MTDAHGPSQLKPAATVNEQTLGDSLRLAERYAAWKELRGQVGHTTKERLHEQEAELGQIVAIDQRNALPLYLMAGLQAERGEWEAVIDSVRRGNRAQNCTDYSSPGDIASPRIAGYLGPFVRASCLAAAQMRVSESLALLSALRVMTTRLALLKPEQDDALIVAAVSRVRIDAMLVKVWERARNPTQLKKSRRVLELDKRWANRVYASVEQGGRWSLGEISRRHLSTREELRDVYTTSERTIVQRAVASMPK